MAYSSLRYSPAILTDRSVADAFATSSYIKSYISYTGDAK